MDFQIGDKVIHGTYGLGEITAIEEQNVHEQTLSCYVVKFAANLTLWVPVDQVERHSLRKPASRAEVEQVLQVITASPDALPTDRMLRRTQLSEQMKSGRLEDVGRLLRDLLNLQRVSKWNEHDRAIFERASLALATEWSHAFDITLPQAQQALHQLMEKKE